MRYKNKYFTFRKKELELARRKRGLSQKQVAFILGYRDMGMISRYESGKSLPTLLAALQFEVLYRVPVAFLFPRLYTATREIIRQREGKMKPALRQHK